MRIFCLAVVCFWFGAKAGTYPIQATYWLNFNGHTNGEPVTAASLTSDTVGSLGSDVWVFKSISGGSLSTNFYYTNIHTSLDRQIAIAGTNYTDTGTNSIAYVHNPNWEYAELQFAAPRPLLCSICGFRTFAPNSHDGSTYDVSLIYGHTNQVVISMNLTDGGSGTNHYIEAHGAGTNAAGLEGGSNIVVDATSPYYYEQALMVTNAPYNGTNGIIDIFSTSYSLVAESRWPTFGNDSIIHTDEILATEFGQFGHPVGHNEVSVISLVIIDKQGRWPMRRPDLDNVTTITTTTLSVGSVNFQ